MKVDLITLSQRRYAFVGEKEVSLKADAISLMTKDMTYMTIFIPMI